MADKKPIVTQWFRGRLEGHYVGTPAGSAAVSQFGSGSRYKLRIYRALIRDIEILESPNAGLDESPDESSSHDGSVAGAQPPVELPEDCFYQAQIDDARLLGIVPRSCFEGSVYDVAVSQLQVTHTTKKGVKTYGRVVGEIYGRFLLPEPDPNEAVQVIEELTAVVEPASTGAEQPLAVVGAPEGEPKASVAGVTGEMVAGAAREIEPLHPPTPPEIEQLESAGHVPVVLLVAVMAVVLGLVGGARPALLWLGIFVPILVIRLVVGGLFKVTAGQRVFGAIVVVMQIVCLGLILLDWWQAGCDGIDPWVVAGVAAAVLLASPLPSVAPLVCTGGGLALVLFLWYGSVEATCKPPPSAPAETQLVKQPKKANTKRPTVDKPGVPRTNDDGSWPRLPPSVAP